jgi:hypothetical protein
MNYAGLVKTLATPSGFEPPRTLAYEGIVATELSREHLTDDVAGINASLELIRTTRGGGWPTGPTDDHEDFIDLVWHECEFRDRKSYSYALYGTDGGYLGCAYFYPLGIRTPLSAEIIDCDVDVSWWVTPGAYEQGYYEMAYRALQTWSTTDFPFVHPHFSNDLIPNCDQQ